VRGLTIVTRTVWFALAIMVLFLSRPGVGLGDPQQALYSADGSEVMIFPNAQAYCTYLISLSAGGSNGSAGPGIVLRRSGTTVKVITVNQRFSPCAGVVPVLTEVVTIEPQPVHGYVLAGTIRPLH
jgi:hypothetical protein